MACYVLTLSKVSRVISSLLQAIADAANETRYQLFETPQTVSRERLVQKLPDIFYDVIHVVEKEKTLYFK
jgi:glucosyl-3-phosphoglycerate synthase